MRCDLILALTTMLCIMLGAALPAPAQESYLDHPDKKVSNSTAVLDDNGVIYIGWIREDKGEETNIYVISSRDGGRTFSEKVKVNGRGDMPAGMHQGPSMAAGPEGELYVAWASGRGGADFTTELRFSRSVDGARTFEPSIVINDDRLPASHGFESIAAGVDGSVYAAWLDGRDRNKGGTSTYFAVSRDRGASFGKNIRLDSGSCPCCRTAVATGPDGAVYAAWRKVFDGDIREVVIAGSRDGGRSFGKSIVVGNDSWTIPGCPHRGPSIAVRGTEVLAAWYTEGAGNTPAVYGAVSVDAGASFSKKPLPWSAGAFPDHPVLGAPSGETLIIWEETTPVVSRIMALLPSGAPRQLNRGIRKAHDPSIYVNRKGAALAVWTQEEIRHSKTGLMTFELGR